MHRRAFALGTAAALTAGGAARAKGRQRAWAALRDFTVDLPPGFVLRPNPIAIDTACVQIMKGSKHYVFVALGDFIAFPLEDQDPTILLETHPSNPVKTASVVANGRRRVAEYLWETPHSDGPWPTHLIVLVYAMPPDQQPIADRIAASVRPKPRTT
jgi:hypothetical protein